MRKGSVWWVDFDPTAGSEIQKTRPAVIVSNDIANRHLSRVVVVPLTGNTKTSYPGNALVTLNDKRSRAMADQIRAVDKLRLRDKLCQLSATDLAAVEDAIRLHLAL